MFTLSNRYNNCKSYVFFFYNCKSTQFGPFECHVAFEINLPVFIIYLTEYHVSDWSMTKA